MHTEAVSKSIASKISARLKLTKSFSLQEVYSKKPLFYCIGGRKSGFDESLELFYKFQLHPRQFPEDCGFFFGSTRLIIFEKLQTIDVPVDDNLTPGDGDHAAACYDDPGKIFSLPAIN
jgi:hypothetical protein